MTRSRQLSLAFGGLGLLIAAAFTIYFGMDPNLDSPAAHFTGIAEFVLCPGSLLFVTFIDAEPGTNGFVLMSVVIAFINFWLYAAIGRVIGKRLWKNG